MRVHVRMLGEFTVTVDGHVVAPSQWGRRGAAQLVKLLALQPGARMSRDQVVDRLWPDLLLDEAAPRLHSAAHYARNALRSRQGVVLKDGMVSLFPGAELDVDVLDFEEAAARARADGGAEAARIALGHYSGELLPDDLYEAWTEEPRLRLQAKRLELLPVAGLLEELVAADPLDERAHLALVRDHVAAGRRQAALHALARMDDVLRRELGTAPGPEAQELRSKAEALPIGAAHSEATSTGQSPRRATLPSPRNRLIGRAGDLDLLVARLSDHRLVTITGAGGAGKSTLAFAVAREVHRREHPEREVVLAELAPARDASDVVRAVAEAAGVQGEGAREAVSLASSLAGRPLLLVLDNCEHLIDACALLVDALLDAAPHTTVLATSREPLLVSGEVEHRIGSLGGEAAELFLERAAAAAGDGVVEPADPRVKELCARLDGLPLAIELAAAQLRHLSLAELVDRLDDRLRLLGGGRPRGGRRHSTLTATIDWSYRLLDDPTRRLFDRLGVFPASFDLSAVQAVTPAAPLAVTAAIGDLVTKSLLVHDPSRSRYHLLETIRLFARERLEASGALSATTEDLRQYAVARAREEPRVQSWLSTELAARSRDDLDTVRLAFEASIGAGDFPGAVDLAVGLSTLWRNSVSYAEGERWVSRLARHDLAPRERLWASILEADVALGAGDARKMRAAAHAAVGLAETVREPGAAVIAAVYDAMVHLDAPDRAAERLELAAASATRVEEPGLERLARGFRVVALQMCGRTEGLRDEAEALSVDSTPRDYARYLCLWAASCHALVERDSAWLAGLMTSQRADLTTTGIRENWLTLYWGALSRVVAGEEFLPSLRRARFQAEAEGRDSEADCVLALAYAAACRDEWEVAAELVGATQHVLLHHTASFIHLGLVGDQLIAPRLGQERYGELAARGRGLVLADVLADHGL
jgi:predicted ATPase/DNA-binding SARP family transcriptional activator